MAAETCERQKPIVLHFCIDNYAILRLFGSLFCLRQQGTCYFLHFVFALYERKNEVQKGEGIAMNRNRGFRRHECAIQRRPRLHRPMVVYARYLPL